MPSIEQIIEVLKLAPRYFVAVGICSGILLLIDEQTSKKLGVFDFTQDYRQWLGVAIIVSISMLVMNWSIKVGTVIRDSFQSHKFRKAIIERLNCLTEEEKQILRFYVVKQSKTNTLRIDDGVVNTLTAHGIIYVSSSRGSIIEGFSHNISELAWDYLNKNPSVLNGTTNFYRTDKRHGLSQIHF